MADKSTEVSDAAIHAELVQLNKNLRKSNSILRAFFRSIAGSLGAMLIVTIISAIPVFFFWKSFQSGELTKSLQSSIMKGVLGGGTASDERKGASRNEQSGALPGLPGGIDASMWESILKQVNSIKNP
jgi:hypothetical protein